MHSHLLRFKRPVNFFKDDAEFWSKVCVTVVNLIAVVALIIGIAETQQLDFRNPEHRHISIEMDLDMTLLRFTSIFVFLYMIFTVITAVFSENMTHFHTISIVSGISTILEITMQIAFIYNLKFRVSHSNYIFRSHSKITHWGIL